MIDIKNIPSSPGVYIYKNSDGQIIYVGKAINLKKRVSQYFQSDEALGYKTTQLVSQIADINFYTVGSEIEALVLESSLIKQYRPKFNSQLKDDKSYIYITITKDKLPIIKPAFKSSLNSEDTFFGPFPDSSAVRSLLKTIRRIFPYYSNKHSSKQCLYCHLGLCPGPNPNIKEYRQNISRIKKILNGNFKKIISQLTKEMKTFSSNQNFEMAKIRRDQITSMNYIISGWRNLNHLYQQVELSEDKNQKVLQELKLVLSPYFPNLKPINRIEAYDISQSGTKFFVGSMTVSVNGQLDNSQYRQFKINSKVTPDDQFMIKEVVYRRLKHQDWSFPDLIVVDGGKPQVSAAIQALNLNKQSPLLLSKEGNKGWILDVAVIGLAKKQETIVIKNGQEWIEINLPKNSPALNHLKLLRDEAHRFANRYRKTLMSKSML